MPNSLGKIRLQTTKWFLRGFSGVRARSHLATTTQSFHIVSTTFNGLYGYQCYCSHLTTRKNDKKDIVVVKCERALKFWGHCKTSYWWLAFSVLEQFRDLKSLCFSVMPACLRNKLVPNLFSFSESQVHRV